MEVPRPGSRVDSVTKRTGMGTGTVVLITVVKFLELKLVE